MAYDSDWSESRRLLVGSYTDGEARGGILTLALDGGGCAGSPLRLRAVRADGDIPNPSFLVRSGGFVLAAHELDDRGCLAVYAPVDGALVRRGACVSPHEAGTCFAAVHPSERCMYGANYLSGSVSSCTLAADGRPGGGLPAVRHEGSSANPERQGSAHVHSLAFVPGTSLLAVVDLGIDAIVLYRTDASGALDSAPAARVDVAAGSGPRMLAFHPQMRLAALVDELSCDVVLYRFDRTGLAWEAIARYDLPREPTCETPLAAHPAFAPDGRRLYVSVRGSDRIALLEMDGDGAVANCEDFPSEGHGPRHIALSPEGGFLAVANLASDDVAVFTLDPRTGLPRDAAHLEARQPSCAVWG